jgi:phosphoheptose isomerase
MIETENIESKFHSLINTKVWNDFCEDLKGVDDVYVIGNGGSWAIATHGANDNFKMTSNKRFFSLDSQSFITAAANDWGYENLFLSWLERMNKNGDIFNGRSMILGVSSSGNSENIIKCLKWGSDNKVKTALLTGKKSKKLKAHPNVNTNEIVLDVDYYHNAEILSLWLFYEMVHVVGNECPEINKDKENKNKKRKVAKKIRKHSYPDEIVNIGIDFDGVIHKCSKGFYDGTIYDDPIEGSLDAIKEIAKNYNIIVYTAKAKPDRPLINGKTGQELVWDWLDKKGFGEYVTEVTSEKPRAVAYIDDKAFRFNNWKDTLNFLNTQVKG